MFMYVLVRETCLNQLKVNESVRDDRRFTISDLSLHFPQISMILQYGIVSSG